MYTTYYLENKYPAPKREPHTSHIDLLFEDKDGDDPLYAAKMRRRREEFF